MGGAGGIGGASGSGGAGGSMTCGMRPRMGCCFTDFDCTYRCYTGMCAAGAEGICKDAPAFGKCWADRDCNAGAVCSGQAICPCGTQCLLPDKPGNCVLIAKR
jgi:hypothetical protein